MSSRADPSAAGAENPWWQDFFSGLAAETLFALSTEEQTRAEVDFLVQALAPAAGARIADVPCGSGRVSLELAARGYRLTGVDFTASFLDEARRAAAERGLSAEFRQHDMRELPWRAEFDHAFCVGNSFGYFDERGNREFLRAIQEILRPGGRFVLQTNLAAESILAQQLAPRWYRLGDVYLLHQTSYDPTTARLTSSYIYIKGGQTERKQAVYQVYTYRELAGMLAEAGFSILESFGSPAREPFRLGSVGLWIVATRE